MYNIIVVSKDSLNSKTKSDVCPIRRKTNDWKVFVIICICSTRSRNVLAMESSTSTITKCNIGNINMQLLYNSRKTKHLNSGARRRTRSFTFQTIFLIHPYFHSSTGTILPSLFLSLFMIYVFFQKRWQKIKSK